MKFTIRENRFLFKWYHGPVLTYLLALSFEGMGWKTKYGESELLRWNSPGIGKRKHREFRPDYEAVNSTSFLACELKVGFSRKRKSELSTSDPHVSQFIRESKHTVKRANSLGLKPIYALVLGCELPTSLMNHLSKLSKNFLFIQLVQSSTENECCYPLIHKANGYKLKLLKSRFNSVSRKNWPMFENYNKSIKKRLRKKNHKDPKSAADDILNRVFKQNPGEVKLQDIFSSLSVGKKLSSW
ncbi:MAG: hypothetical protein ACYS0I_18340 [Planctomycetota bacterium]|jgi:hypothetical protein